jgi:hypothetical protein
VVLVADGVPGVAGAVADDGPDGGTESAVAGFPVSPHAAAAVTTAIASKQLLTSRDVFRIGQVLHGGRNRRKCRGTICCPPINVA